MSLLYRGDNCLCLAHTCGMVSVDSSSFTLELGWARLGSTLLYSAVLSVLPCAMLCCVLFCIVLCPTVVFLHYLCCIMNRLFLPHCTVLGRILLLFTVLNCAVLYRIAQYSRSAESRS